MAADLAVDTSVRADPDVAGRYHVTLPDHWDYLAPSGGVVMTCALRAAETHLGPWLARKNVASGFGRRVTQQEDEESANSHDVLQNTSIRCFIGLSPTWG